MKPCGHVTCKTCCDSLVRPAKQCVVCDVQVDNEIIELKREGKSYKFRRCFFIEFVVGTGFAAGGLAETSKAGIAFQG